MPNRPPVHRPPHAAAAQRHRKANDVQRAAQKPWQQWRRSPRWFELRRRRLNAEPTCRYCRQRGIVTPATVVDHVVPHRGSEKLFLDFDNTQSLCKTCHDAVKQSFERTGRLRGCNSAGWPLDERHEWNQRKPDDDDDR